MYYLRIIIGSLFFAIGVVGVIWFIKNLFRDKFNRPMLFSHINPVILLFIIVILILGGLWIFSDFKEIPLIGLFAGIIIAWKFVK